MLSRGKKDKDLGELNFRVAARVFGLQFHARIQPRKFLKPFSRRSRVEVKQIWLPSAL
jgi:hypothetical protein